MIQLVKVMHNDNHIIDLTSKDFKAISAEHVKVLTQVIQNTSGLNHCVCSEKEDTLSLSKKQCCRTL